MKRSIEMAIYHRQDIAIVGGKFVTTVKPIPVRVLARAEGYAMVRRPGAMPFAVSERDLTPEAKS